MTTNVKADDSNVNVTFTLLENFYSIVTKSYQNGITIFDLTNNLEDMNLTNNELKQILSQKPGNGSSRLTYYETLNIKVTPNLGTNFDPLVGKTTYYRGSSGGSWVNSLDKTLVTKSPEADLKNMDSSFWPYGFKIHYRTDPNGNYTSTIPVGANLLNKTLEEQLATLLNINLDSNPNGVINEYKNLFVFRPLNNYTYLTRFDFYSQKEGVTPTLIGSSYDINSLKELDSYYVAIKYHKPISTSTTEEAFIPKENIKKTDTILLVSFASIIIAISIYFYYKKIKK